MLALAGASNGVRAQQEAATTQTTTKTTTATPATAAAPTTTTTPATATTPAATTPASAPAATTTQTTTTTTTQPAAQTPAPTQVPVPVLAPNGAPVPPANPAAAANTTPNTSGFLGHWTTSAELGAINTTGNTVGTSVTGKINSRQELEDWSNEYNASGFFKDDEVTLADGSKQRQRSAQQYAFSAKAGYKLLKDNAKLFVLGSHVSDKFGAYTKYSSINVGHSSQWYKSPDSTLDVELGPGYFRGSRPNGLTENGLTVRIAGGYRWKVSETANFVQTLSVERGTSNTHSSAETSLATKIIDRMQLKAGFTVRSDSDVQEPSKHTDTQTSLTVVYSF